MASARSTVHICRAMALVLFVSHSEVLVLIDVRSEVLVLVGVHRKVLVLVGVRSVHKRAAALALVPVSSYLRR